MEYLYDKLKKYCQEDYYPFHMPGHKRNVEYMEMLNPYKMDITEIDGFDNLHHSEDILKAAQERAAKVYGSEETHFLINGSTAGLLSAVSACVEENGVLLMARNSHKAVYNSVYVNKIRNIYTYPQKSQKSCVNCGLNVEEIEQLIKNNENIQAILITSPTYDGVVSDVNAIAKIAHNHNIPLIVDEAHGAHFPFSEAFPMDSIKNGADIVIHSVHKTMPALTQTALLHINGNLVNREKVRKYLGIFQTSSPSYVLMSSIDNCIRLVEEKGEELFEKYKVRLENFRNTLGDLKELHLIKKEDLLCFDYDNSKIIISAENTAITGKQLHNILLNRYHLEMEMSNDNYCLGMTSIMDTEEGFQRFYKALYEIDELLVKGFKYEDIMSSDLKSSNIEKCKKVNKTDKNTKENADNKEFGVKGVIENRKDKNNLRKSEVRNKKILEIWEAEKRPGLSIKLEESVGKIAGEYVYLYPPGIPLIVPGEAISQEFIERLNDYKAMNLNIEGPKDYRCEYIKVIG